MCAIMIIAEILLLLHQKWSHDYVSLVIIDDISSGASRADARIRRETQRIEETRRKEKTYCTCG